MARAIVTLLGPTLVMLCPSLVLGQESVVRPGSRPFFLSFALGPAIEMVNDWGTQIKLDQSFGYHFSGSFEGPALGFQIQESFANCTDVDNASCVSIELGPKFWWDIPPDPEVGFYLTPALRVGYTFVNASVDWFVFSWDGSAHACGIELSLAGRLVLGDRAMLFFQPITIDMAIGGPDDDLQAMGYDENFAMRWDILFGAGVIF